MTPRKTGLLQVVAADPFPLLIVHICFVYYDKKLNKILYAISMIKRL